MWRWIQQILVTTHRHQRHVFLVRQKMIILSLLLLLYFQVQPVQFKPYNGSNIYLQDYIYIYFETPAPLCKEYPHYYTSLHIHSHIQYIYKYMYKEDFNITLSRYKNPGTNVLLKVNLNFQSFIYYEYLLYTNCKVIHICIYVTTICM